MVYPGFTNPSPLNLQLGIPVGALVLASLLMADELHDTRVELETLRGAAGEANAVPAAKPRRDQEAKRLGRLALRAEQVANKLDVDYPAAV